jgi:hypothetical protein
VGEFCPRQPEGGIFSRPRSVAEEGAAGAEESNKMLPKPTRKSQSAQYGPICSPARFRRLDMDGFEYILLNFEYILLNFEYILLNLPRAEVGVTAEKFRRIYSRFRRKYSNSGGYIQN